MRRIRYWIEVKTEGGPLIDKVHAKGYGAKAIPEGNYEISEAQYNQDIIGATIVTRPTIDSEGNLLEDAVLA